jgi:hypothetical protein
MKRVFGPLLVAWLSLVGVAAHAQIAGGNVYGTVIDSSGAAVPGATVAIASSDIGGQPRTTLTGADGDFRFLNLDHGRYAVTVSLTGFTTVRRDVVVNTGVNVTLSVSLSVVSVAESLTVTAETPVVDAKRVGTATTFTSDDLTKVPQGRDPWAVLRNVPGVLVDRVSVAGNEAGQQSLFVGKGAQLNDTTWNLDGIVITDTTSYGGSSTYFDFDSFDEINVSTGGSDLKNPSGGVGLNLVTKRGTNSFHGTARTYMSNHKFGESTNTPSGVTSGLFDGRADQILQIADYGADFGGPVVKDKLWFWGSYGRNDIRLYRFYNESQDKTLLVNWNGKVNWQASSNDMVSFFFNSGAKDKFGRDPGQTAHDAPSFLWNQGNFYPTSDCGLPCSLHGLFKVEVNHTFSPSLFLDVKYAYDGWGYGFDPAGGSQDAYINHVTDSATGSWTTTRFLKPWHTANADGEYFVDAVGGRNELKFGFGYRHWPNTSSIHFNGDGVVGIINNTNPTDPFSSVAWVTRQAVVKYTADNANGYVGDTYTRGRLTLNAGIRYDHQNAHNDSSTAAANPARPDLVPSLSFNGNSTPINWNDWSPRVGATVALDESRKAVARASYARYAGQLGPLDVTYGSPITYGYTYLAYQWQDLNGDGRVQPNEIMSNRGVLYSGLINPAQPGQAAPFNRVDPKYHASHDNEAIVGIEREIAKDFSLGITYTFRRSDGQVDYFPRIDSNGNVFTTSNYTPLPPVSVGGYTAAGYAPVSIGNGQLLLTNRPDFYETYSGAEITANKRLSNRWMFRAGLTLQNWTQHFSGPNAFQNPTSTDVINFGGNGIVTQFGGANVDGGIVVNQSYGAKKNTFFAANWQVSSTALYQLGAGFEISASLLGRQGYPKGLFIREDLGSDGGRHVLVGPFDLQRYDDVWDLDMRLAKNFSLGGATHLGLSLDCFNLFNSGSILQQGRQVNATNFGTPVEVLNPRILRLGVRLGF